MQAKACSKSQIEVIAFTMYQNPKNIRTRNFSTDNIHVSQFPCILNCLKNSAVSYPLASK